MKIWIDGSGWNGKQSRCAIACENGNTWIERFDTERTNNEMEYQALLSVLKQHITLPGDEILSDSQLIVNQVNGNWKVKEQRLFPLCQEAQRLLKIRNVKLTWIPREQNKAGHLLEK